MSLRESCQLILAAEKDPTTSSNYSGKQKHGVISYVIQLSKKAHLTKKTLLNFSLAISLTVPLKCRLLVKSRYLSSQFRYSFFYKLIALNNTDDLLQSWSYSRKYITSVLVRLNIKAENISPNHN